MVSTKFQTLVTETSLPKFAVNLVEMLSFHTLNSVVIFILIQLFHHVYHYFSFMEKYNC